MAKDNEYLIPVNEQPADGKKKKYISLEVYYDKGGVAMFTGRSKPRGIYISAGPIALEDSGTGYHIRSFMMMSGKAQLVEEAKRLNQKRVKVLFDEAVADFKAKQGPAWILVNMVAEKNGLTLKEEPAPEPAPA